MLTRRFFLMSGRLVGAVLLLTALTAGSTFASGATYWPSDREQKLSALDEQLLDVQRKMFNARMTGDLVTVEQLGPVFKDVKKERLELLRALGKAQ